jgi:hypothetical protein
MYEKLTMEKLKLFGCNEVFTLLSAFNFIKISKYEVDVEHSVDSFIFLSLILTVYTLTKMPGV